MDLYELNEKNIKVLMSIETEFGFESGWLCMALAKLLGHDVYQYEDQQDKLKKTRLSKTKEHLSHILTIVTQLEEACKVDSIKTQIALRFGKHGEIQEKLETLLNNEYKLSLSKEILSIEDNGRLPGTLRQYLIYSLLKIYIEGTKKSPKVGVDSSYNSEGVGEAHNFLMKIQEVFSEIDKKLYLGTSQSIAVTANKIINMFSEISFFSKA